MKLALEPITFDLRVLIPAFALAVALFVFYTYYHKRVLGVFVRALLEDGANSPETAKTPESLGAKLTPAVRRSLFSGSLSDVVRIVAPEGEEVSEDTLWRCAFFLAADKENKARGIYAGDQSLFASIFITAAAFVLALILWLLFPQIAKLFS